MIDRIGRENIQVDWRDRMSGSPEICHGKPRIKGTQIMVAIILDGASEGLNSEEIARSHASFNEEDNAAAMQFNAQSLAAGT